MLLGSVLNFLALLVPVKVITRVVNFLLSYLLLGSLLGACGAWAADLIVSPVIALPTPEQYQKWVDHFFEHDDFWPFENKQDLVALVEASDLDLSVKNQILESWKAGCTPSQSVNSLFLYGGIFYGGRVYLKETLLNKLTPRFFQSVYSYFFQRLETGYRVSVEKKDLESLQIWIFANFSARKARRYQNYVVNTEGLYRLPIFSHMWKDLPQKSRTEIVDQQLERSSRINQSLHIQLQLAPHEDVVPVARLFAGSRNPAILERFLIRQQRVGKLMVPLESLLMPFIRTKSHSFSDVHGPNCFQSAANSNCAKSDFTSSHILKGQKLLMRLWASHRFVRPEEPLQTGDVIVSYQEYSDGAYVVHAATFIAPYFVFAKNGASRFSPYVIQYLDHNTRLYQGEQFEVYRKTPFGNTILMNPSEAASVAYEIPIEKMADDLRAAIRGPTGEASGSALCEKSLKIQL